MEDSRYKDRRQVSGPDRKSRRPAAGKSSPRPVHRLYRAGKISDAIFRRVLWHFVRDHTAADTARALKLSANSVTDMFRKIRVYFFEAGLFMDVHGGTGEAAFDPALDAEFERDLLRFHYNRLRSRHGVRIDPDRPDYHLAESWWRLDFAMIARERPSESVYDMMLGQLLAVIRVAGPVGGKPGNFSARKRVLAQLVDQKILWFQRNAAGFATPELRAGLDDALKTKPGDL
jgi:hypothetical protein